MTARTHDLIVIGAGPAGASAALAAAQSGLRVVLVDENEAAGGQVYRRPLRNSGAKRSADAKIGDALRERISASSIETKFGHRVWFAEAGFRVCAVGPTGPAEWQAERLVVASGAQERHRPVPGWTLPGVIGLAGATNLLKAHRVMPGRRTLIAGTGPLLLYVASLILQAGGRVAGVVDARDRVDWLSEIPRLLARPDLAFRGLGWYSTLRKAGVPILHGHILRQIDGTNSVDRAWIAPHGLNTKSISINCDSVCFGYGLVPATEIARLLDVTHRYDPARGGWAPDIGADGSTNVQNLYLCGDGAGLVGAAASAIQGEIVGLAVSQKKRSIRGALALDRSVRFGAAMTALSTPPPSALEAVTPETIVCRCERLSRSVLDDAIGAGAHTINALKSATRCGMGACGGRVCEDTAASLIGLATGRTRDQIGQATPRPPLRPVALATLAGEFDYASLPMPEPAPQ